jgi:glycosyltransferase involved in cell wall biosynthesis
MQPLVLVSKSININGKYPDRNNPRQDYIEIAQRLQGQPFGYNLSDGLWYQQVRRIEKSIKLDVAEALHAARQFTNYDCILSLSEKVGIPLEALRRLSNHNIPHVVIAHKLSSGHKKRLFPIWNPNKSFSHIICVSRQQVNYAINYLDVPKQAIDFVYDKVDHEFFHPMNIDIEDYILAVGQEQRDYQTLLKAIEGTGIRLVIVASSLWSTYKIQVSKKQNVTILSHIPYQDLKELYAKARLVVIPLFNVDYAAGVNSILEALAMGKPVITNNTPGICDYIIHDKTGQLVPPEHITELKHSILSLWGQPKEQKRLSINARQVVVEKMNLDIYVDKVANIMQRVYQNYIESK